jgi:hypothetical protein
VTVLDDTWCGLEWSPWIRFQMYNPDLSSYQMVQESTVFEWLNLTPSLILAKPVEVSGNDVHISVEASLYPKCRLMTLTG